MQPREGNEAGEPRGERLPASHRLRKRAEFKRVQDGGQRYSAEGLLLLMRPNALGRRRLGVTVSSKVGNSVVRSKVKRWFREIFRKHRQLLPPSVDVVLIARSAAAGSSLERLLQDFRKVAEQASRRAPAKGNRAAPPGGSSAG